jgi:hypothetical protein
MSFFFQEAGPKFLIKFPMDFLFIHPANWIIDPTIYLKINKKVTHFE